MGLVGSRSRQSTGQQVGSASSEAFREAAKSPVFDASNGVMFCSGFVAGGYGLLLSLATLWPSTLALRASWLAATAPVTQAVSLIVPSVGRLSADLAHRGFAARVPVVSHVIAFEWLIIATHFLISAIILVPERARLAKGFAAAREAYLRLRPGGMGWRKWALILAAAVMLLMFPLDGDSHRAGRYAYDLAETDNGLFIPFLLTIWLWWGIVYYFWLRLLALWAAYDNLPGPARS